MVRAAPPGNPLVVCTGHGPHGPSAGCVRGCVLFTVGIRAPNPPVGKGELGQILGEIVIAGQIGYAPARAGIGQGALQRRFLVSPAARNPV